jgi:hypothetical protein
MSIASDAYIDSRRAEQPVRIDIPAGLLQHPASRCGKAYEACHGRAGREAD